MEAYGIACWMINSRQYYYVPARHIRLIPNEELTPLSPNVPDENKRVEVRLDDQLLLAYEKRANRLRDAHLHRRQSA